MAASNNSKQVFKDNNNGNLETTRSEIKAAIAKAVELRALHAALIRGNSSANAKFKSPSPVSRSVSQFSAHDYPVFTPVRFFFASIMDFIYIYFYLLAQLGTPVYVQFIILLKVKLLFSLARLSCMKCGCC